MRFRLLGQFEITAADGTPCVVSAPKVRQVLALLLVRSGDVVPVDALVRELWGGRPPRSALTTLQTYVYHARRLLEVEPDRQQLVVTRPAGYLVDAPEHEVDVRMFQSLLARGRDAQAAGDQEQAADLLGRGLALWRRTALTGVPQGEVLRGHLTQLEELRIRGTELHVEALRALGRHEELVPELRAVIRDYPLNEWFHGELIRALNATGQRLEALRAYHELCRVLDEELGLTPTAEVQRLRHEIRG